MKAIICTIIAGASFIAGCYLVSMNRRYHVFHEFSGTACVLDNWTGKAFKTSVPGYQPSRNLKRY